MADTEATTTATSTPGDETPNQRQARLRREKRQKKMTEQGEDRLAKIKALNGGIAPPDEVLGGPVAAVPKVASVVDDDDDPEEVDISAPSFRPTRGDPLANALAQMQGGEGMGGGGGGGDDPMMKMMQQMMGQMGGQSDPNNPNASQQDLPPMLQALMGGGGGGAGPQQSGPQATTSGTAYLWRITHALFAFLLAFYITLTSTFNGTQLSRSQSVNPEEYGYGLGPRLFIIFTSSELVLQSTRYFLEKGQLQGGGPLAFIANSGFVPEPYANYIRMVGRYIGIAKTIFSDVMVIVFVMGCMAWWRGEGAAPLV